MSEDTNPVFACDVGGTGLRTALVSGGKVLYGARERMLSGGEKKDPRLLVLAIASAYKEAAATAPRPPIAIAVSIPGIIDAKLGVVKYARNLNLNDAHIGDELQKMTGIATAVENDAKAAAWGEFVYGAGRGTKDMVFVSAGTGLGGAAIVNGELYRGMNNAAGEFGHMSIDWGGAIDSCNNFGCAKSYISGRDLEKRFGEPFEEIAALASAGGEKERAIVRDVVKALSVTLVNLVNAFDPDIVVLGGGVSRTPRLWEELEESYERLLRPYVPLRALLKQASLYDERGTVIGGLVGVADLACRRAMPQ